jgi:hypothetical protein
VNIHIAASLRNSIRISCIQTSKLKIKAWNCVLPAILGHVNIFTLQLGEQVGGTAQPHDATHKEPELAKLRQRSSSQQLCFRTFPKFDLPTFVQTNMRRFVL